jgi:hypothetical protein
MQAPGPDGSSSVRFSDSSKIPIVSDQRAFGRTAGACADISRAVLFAQKALAPAEAWGKSPLRIRRGTQMQLGDLVDRNQCSPFHLVVSALPVGNSI